MRDVTPDAPAPTRRSLSRYSGALGAAVSPSPAACSAGPESTNDTGGAEGGKNSTLTAVTGYGNDGSWDPTRTASALRPGERARGGLPSATRPPSGCPFRTRCWKADDDCAEIMPDFTAASARDTASAATILCRRRSRHVTWSPRR